MLLYSWFLLAASGSESSHMASIAANGSAEPSPPARSSDVVPSSPPKNGWLRTIPASFAGHRSISRARRAAWIVHSYLLHYGYQDTVNLFDVESGIMCPYIPTPQENGLNIQGDTYALNNRKIVRQMSDCWNTTKEHWGREGFSMMGPYNLDSSSFSDAISQLDMASILGGDDNVWALIPELKLHIDILMSYTHISKVANVAGSNHDTFHPFWLYVMGCMNSNKGVGENKRLRVTFVKVPRIYWNYTRKAVLTMELLYNVCFVVRMYITYLQNSCPSRCMLVKVHYEDPSFLFYIFFSSIFSIFGIFSFVFLKG